ncbi:hypothetical protein KGO95_00440 [Patescibacteria group bacterium]|nr:hypothetical protein [Patescibacteria group bacterium]
MERISGIALIAIAVLSLSGDHYWLALICSGLALVLLTVHWIAAILLVLGGIGEKAFGEPIRAFMNQE